MNIMKYLFTVTIVLFISSNTSSQERIINNAQVASNRIELSPDEIASIRQTELLNRNVVVGNSNIYTKYLPRNTEIQNVTTGIRNGLEYTLIKFRNTSDGSIGSVFVDAKGQITNDKYLPPIKRGKIETELNIALADAKDNDLFDVEVGFVSNVPRPETNSEIVRSYVTDSDPTYFIDGVEVTADKIKENRDPYLQALESYEQRRNDNLRALKNSFLSKLGISSRRVQLDNDSSLQRVILRKDEIMRASEEVNILSISLYSQPETDINNAVQWSGINDHARFGSHRGAGIGIWQTEPGCAPDNWPPIGNINTPYSGPASASLNPGNFKNITRHAEDMARVMRVVSPLAFIECRQGGLPTMAQANSTSPQIQVSTRSATFGTLSSNYRSQDRATDVRTAISLVPHVNSASNITASSPFTVIRAGARGLNILTIGNANIDTTPASIALSSKWANSNIQNEKPEVSSPGIGTFLPALTRSTGGTSAATAHTAGFIANLLDNDETLIRRPMGVKSLVMSGSTSTVTGGITRVGVGGVNYRDTSQFYDARHFRFTGTVPLLVESVYLDTSKPNVRAVISWMNNGNFTFSNGTLSVDWDLEVVDPSGNIVASSMSHINPYESVDFTITTSGTYDFRIIRWAQITPFPPMTELGLVVNWDD